MKVSGDSFDIEQSGNESYIPIRSNHNQTSLIAADATLFVPFAMDTVDILVVRKHFPVVPALVLAPRVEDHRQVLQFDALALRRVHGDDFDPRINRVSARCESL